MVGDGGSGDDEVVGRKVGAMGDAEGKEGPE